MAQVFGGVLHPHVSLELVGVAGTDLELNMLVNTLSSVIKYVKCTVSSNTSEYRIHYLLLALVYFQLCSAVGSAMSHILY